MELKQNGFDDLFMSSGFFCNQNGCDCGCGEGQLGCLQIEVNCPGS